MTFPYFNPLRRKLGVVTLLATCTLMAGWVRSFTLADWIEGSKFKIISFEGGVCWEYTENLHEFMRKLSISTTAAAHVAEQYHFLSASARWSQQLLGFARKTYGGDSRKFGGVIYNPAFRVYRVPYWSIVVPLALLSAWLLFSKPRAERFPVSKSKKI